MAEVEGFPRVRRLDAEALVGALRREHGVRLEISGYLDGGQVGAALVRWPDGREAVLKWRSDYSVEELTAGPLAAAEALRDRGYPAPATQLAVQVGTAVVTVQELLPGKKIDHMDEGLFEQAVALNARHVGVLAGREDVPRNHLYLREDGPGYCLHEPLRRFSARTAALAERIESIGAQCAERLPGEDVVHQDFHPGNMLSVDGRISGVIDWDGAGRGDARFDLVTLRFGIHPAGVEPVVTRRLDALLDAIPPDALLPAWAHMSLRMTDWAIRHFPSDEVGTWVALAERRL
jgi:Ser/Thr protein kinase RdoA (MazF antagonist)